MRTIGTRWLVVAAVAAVTALAAVPAQAMTDTYGPWEQAAPVEAAVAGNSSQLSTPFLDGCPHQSPDGLSLYLASNRPRFAGDTRTDLDIWVAHRSSVDAPFGDPVNLGAPVNSLADDFCPTPVRGEGLFFVSRRVTADSCGMGDVYRTREHPEQGWTEPEHLACEPFGPNSPLDEQGPSYVAAGGPELYFSRGATGIPGDVYVSRMTAGGFGSAQPVTEVNDAMANDIQPNVRRDGREMVLSSNRNGTAGAQDIWVSTRSTTAEPWSAPENLGPAVNTAAAETRPSLSWHGETLLFGRAPGPEGSSDMFVTTRARD
jgi:hypothetical protein